MSSTTHTTAAPGGLYPTLPARFSTLLRGWAAAFLRARAQARAARIADEQLARMSDRDLADIGLTRSSLTADPDHRSHIERDALSARRGW